MDRIKRPNGSQVNFETTVDAIQDKAFSNLTKRVKQIFSSFGVNLTSLNGALGSELEVSLISSNATVSVASGSAITSAGNYFNVNTTRTTDNLTVANPNKGYIVVLTYSEAGTDPVKSINAFVYDKLGSESLDRKTTFSDSVQASLVEITGTLSEAKAGLSTNQVVIAAV